MTAPCTTVFRRRMITVASGNRIHAAIEDDFHHYELLIRHDGNRVTSIEAKSLRTPWVTCHEAGARLDELIDHPVSTRPSGLPDPHHQCTHMFELASVALGQAIRGGQRCYQIAIPYRPLGGATHATLHRDDVLILEWHVEGDVIIGPAQFQGRNVRAIVPWASETFDDDEFEAIKVLRRALHVSSGRSVAFEKFATAADIKQAAGACYVFQPEQASRSARNLGSRRDFTLNPEAPLADFKYPLEELPL